MKGLIKNPEVLGIKNFSFENGLLNVMGDVNLTRVIEFMDRLPFDFGVVEGNFYCANNNLSSFEGFPTVVKGSLGINNNKFTSLKGITQVVGTNLNCSNNFLTSLEGVPNKINHTFDCSNNRLTKIDNCPVAETLIFRNNEIKKIQKLSKQVKFLDLSNNPIELLDLENITVSDTLFLTNTNIQRLNPDLDIKFINYNDKVYNSITEFNVELGKQLVKNTIKNLPI